MTQFRKLQLNLLSQGGELLNCVNCFAGQVSVFRAVTVSALEPYQRALAGIPGSERFSVLLDGQSFLPHEHTLIGFGEQFLDRSLSVAQFLVHCGVPQGTLDSLLMSYGLEHVEQSSCPTLSKCEERRVRLLGAVYATGKVIVLNNPFEPIADQWKERFAELVVTTARSKKLIVIVTSLSYRPECWIDNESIARIQVGESIQKTIGFGSGPSNMNSFVTQMREILKDEDAVKNILEGKTEPPQAATPPPPPVQPPPDTTHRNTERPRERVQPKTPIPPPQRSVELTQHISSDRLSGLQKMPPLQAGQLIASIRNELHSRRARFMAILILAIMVYLLAPGGEDSIDPGSMASTGTNTQEGADQNAHQASLPQNPAQPPVEVAHQVQPQTNQNISPNQAIVQVQAPEPTLVPTEPTPAPQLVALVLDEYPPSIRESILESFQGNVVAVSASTGNHNVAPVMSNTAPSGKTQEAGDLLRLLQSASDTGGPDSEAPQMQQDPGAPSFPQDITTEEQKREMIRRKFLEAIERAAEKRRANPEL